MLYCEASPFQNGDEKSVHPVFRGRKHVHLFADSLGELVEFATSIGMKRSWLQRSGGFVHFDCTGRYMRACLMSDAVTKLTRREFVTKMREIRAQGAAA